MLILFMSVLFRLQILMLLLWIHPRSTTQPLNRLRHHLWISAIVRPRGLGIRAGWWCSSIARRERVLSWSTSTLSLMMMVMKVRHRRCSRFLLCRITSSFTEYSPLLSSLSSIFQSVSLLQKKTKHSIPSPNSTPFENLANSSCGWINNLEYWNQIRKLSSMSD